MKYFLLVFLIGLLMCFAIWKIGYETGYENFKQAYYINSSPRNRYPHLKTMPATDGTMLGFGYKRRFYPLMTKEEFKMVVDSQIWFDKDWVCGGQ